MTLRRLLENINKLCLLKGALDSPIFDADGAEVADFEVLTKPDGTVSGVRLLLDPGVAGRRMRKHNRTVIEEAINSLHDIEMAQAHDPCGGRLEWFDRLHKITCRLNRVWRSNNIAYLDILVEVIGDLGDLEVDMARAAHGGDTKAREWFDKLYPVTCKIDRVWKDENNTPS